MKQIVSNGTTFLVKLKKIDTNSNYNTMAYVFRKGEKTPIAGTSFKENEKPETITNWATMKINAICKESELIF